MFSVALVTFVSTIALADPRVDVPGVGTVKLKDAVATCVKGEPVGGVEAAVGNTRFPALQQVGKGLAGSDAATRTAYFKFNGDLDWPTDAAQYEYVPAALPWAPVGVVGSCYAAGKYYVDFGIELDQSCRQPKGTCNDLYFPEEESTFTRAFKASKTEIAGRDPMFATLVEAGDTIESWRDPAPLLQAACEYPQNATNAGKFIDGDDLNAARWACLQQVALLGHELVDFTEANKCDTPWARIAGDTERVTVYPSSDLGLTGHDPAAQLRSAHDRLKRMDPSPGTCGSGWAANWRKKLVNRWITDQHEGACADERLDPVARRTLCPEVVAAKSIACEGGDTAACEWFTYLFEAQLRAGRVDDANRLLDTVASLLGPAWIKSAKTKLEDKGG